MAQIFPEIVGNSSAKLLLALIGFYIRISTENRGPRLFPENVGETRLRIALVSHLSYSVSIMHVIMKTRASREP